MEFGLLLPAYHIYVRNKDYKNGIALIERLSAINPDFMSDPNVQRDVKALKQLKTKEMKKFTKKISIGIAAVAIVASLGYFALKMNQNKN